MVKIMALLFSTFVKRLLLLWTSNLSKDCAMLNPTIKRKNGNTKSVGVHPSHGACLKGAYTYCQEPGVLTIIINAIVIPLRISIDSSRLVVIFILSKSKFLANLNNIFNKLFN
jgi:hypothetical protein